jgi:hypothetical protein
MAELYIKGEVSLLPVPGAGWDLKIGCKQASSTVKRGFGAAKRLANPVGGKIFTKTAKNGSFTP